MPIFNLSGKAGRKTRKRVNQASVAKAKELKDNEQNASSASRHRENTFASGEVSQSWFAFVHTPISIQKTVKITAGKASLEKELVKLESKKAWDLENPCEYDEVRTNASRAGKLCHVEHSELSSEYWSYKGWVVFQGNNVKDENVCSAVFSEQGTSASHLAAAKFLDAMGRMNGNDGPDSDAMSGYTQVEHTGVDTWVFIPKDWQLKSWDKVLKLGMQTKA